MEQESMDFSVCMETAIFHPSGSYYQDPVPQLISTARWCDHEIAHRMSGAWNHQPSDIMVI